MVSSRPTLLILLLALAGLMSGCKEPSTTDLSSSGNPSSFGNSITFTARISAAGIPLAVSLGTVTFSDGAVVLGSSSPNNSGVATYTIASLSVGNHNIIASYSGTTYVASSHSNSISQLIRKGQPKLSLQATSDPSLLGSPVTFAATIAGPAGSAQGGAVSFQDGSTFIGTATPDNAGVATLTVPSPTSPVLGLGSHTIRATYLGNVNFVSGSTMLSQEVLPTNTILPTDNSGGVSAAPSAGQFAVGADGSATYAYPIWVPEGRRGIQPRLSITYNSRRDNGMLGVGWSLQGLSVIARCKRDMARDGLNAPVQFSDSDVFCMDGQRLVTYPSLNSNPKPECGTGDTVEYRTEEETFVRVLSGPSDGGGKGPEWFEADFKDGRIFCYGTTTGSRLEGQRFHIVPQSLSGVDVTTDLSESVRFAWSLAEVRDHFGNNMTVSYSVTGQPPAQGFEQLPQKISYTGTVDQTLAAQRTITFQYEDRCDQEHNCDTPSTFVSGLMLQTRHRLSQIILSAPNPISSSPVKQYQFTYRQSQLPRATLTGRSLLSQISECDAAGICLPPTTFSYSQATIPDGFVDFDTGIHDDTASGENTPSVGPTLGQIVVGDFNGDGCDDFIYTVFNNPQNPQDLALVHASYQLSACYDSMSSGAAPFTWQDPNQQQLSPDNGTVNSKIPPTVFVNSSGFVCDLSAQGTTYLCDTSLVALDLDLDTRADLVWFESKFPFPAPSGEEEIGSNTSIFLASSIPPSQWNPGRPLFQGVTHISSDDNVAVGPPPVPDYFSLVIGDFNGDGYPDLLTMLPTVWSYQLNHGNSNCGIFGNPCLNLDPRSSLFSGDAPFQGLRCGGVFPNGFTHVAAVDINNVGTADLLLRDPNGNNWYAAFSLDAVNQTKSENLALLGGEVSCPLRHDWFVDINGDGLPDSVSIPNGGGNPFVALNTGNGFQSPEQITVDVPLPSENLLMFDYDGDGSQDLIYPSGPGLRALVGLGRLAGTSVSSIALNAIGSDFNLSPIPNGQSLEALDVNGDGLMDLIQIVNGDIHIYVRQGLKRDLLNGINDRGAMVAIGYAPISSSAAYQTTVAPGVVSSSPGAILPPMTFPAAQTYLMNRGPWVVKSVSMPRAGNLGSPNAVNTYKFVYQDARVSLLGRGWLGFGKVIETDQQTGVVTTTTYDNTTLYGSAYPYAKRPLSQRVDAKLSSNGLFHENVVTNSYQTQGSSNPFSGAPDGRYFAVTPIHTSEKEYEGASQLSIQYRQIPKGDAGSFNVQIDGIIYAASTQNGDNIGPEVLATGTHTIVASANAGTDQSKYAFIIGGDCSQNANQGTIVMNAGDSKLCTITVFRQEPLMCYVFDDGYSNIEGPSDAIFISGRSTNNEAGKACIPGGQFGHCHKWFGRCFTTDESRNVYFNVFDDGYTNVAGPTDAIFISKTSGQACIPDGTTTGSCRKWFGRAVSNDGRTVACAVFDDGYANITGLSDAIFIPSPIPGPGQACVPNVGNGNCHRWFGRCNTQSLVGP